jgi:hypothetical protein
MKVPIKNADNNNNDIDAFKRVLEFNILAHFEGINIVVRKNKRLLWLVHMISVFYIAIRKEDGGSEEGLIVNQSLCPTHSPSPDLIRLDYAYPTITEAKSPK